MAGECHECSYRYGWSPAASGLAQLCCQRVNLTLCRHLIELLSMLQIQQDSPILLPIDQKVVAVHVTMDQARRMHLKYRFPADILIFWTGKLSFNLLQK